MLVTRNFSGNSILFIFSAVSFSTRCENLHEYSMSWSGPTDYFTLELFGFMVFEAWSFWKVVVDGSNERWLKLESGICKHLEIWSNSNSNHWHGYVILPNLAQEELGKIMWTFIILGVKIICRLWLKKQTLLLSFIQISLCCV